MNEKQTSIPVAGWKNWDFRKQRRVSGESKLMWNLNETTITTPNAAFCSLKCFYHPFFPFFSMCQWRSATQQACLALRQSPSLLTRPCNHPAICTCSNYYPITNKYRTITTRNPYAQAAAGWGRAKKKPKQREISGEQQRQWSDCN